MEPATRDPAEDERPNQLGARQGDPANVKAHERTDRILMFVELVPDHAHVRCGGVWPGEAVEQSQTQSAVALVEPAGDGLVGVENVVIVDVLHRAFWRGMLQELRASIACFVGDFEATSLQDRSDLVERSQDEEIVVSRC